MNKKVKHWFVTTDTFVRRGKVVLGPFVNREAALNARTYIEKLEGHGNYWVDSQVWPRRDS